MFEAQRVADLLAWPDRLQNYARSTVDSSRQFRNYRSRKFYISNIICLYSSNSKCSRNILQVRMHYRINENNPSGRGKPDKRQHKFWESITNFNFRVKRKKNNGKVETEK